MAAQAYYVSIPFISFQSRKRVRRQKTEVRRQKAEDKRLKKTEGLKVGGLEGWLPIYPSKHLNFYKTGLYVFNPKS